MNNPILLIFEPMDLILLDHNITYFCSMSHITPYRICVSIWYSTRSAVHLKIWQLLARKLSKLDNLSWMIWDTSQLFHRSMLMIIIPLQRIHDYEIIKNKNKTPEFQECCWLPFFASTRYINYNQYCLEAHSVRTQR